MERRSLVAAVGAASLAAVAGCNGLSPDHGDDPSTATPETYDLLTDRRVYLASGVSLTLPPDARRTDSPDGADLVILPGTTDVGPWTGVEWLAAGTGVGFVGSEGQARLVEWMESDAYDEAFESSGVGVASPPPDFLLAFGVDQQYVSKYGYTWNDDAGITDDRILDGIEEALRDVQTR